jgi:hypothetical protein
MVWRLRYPRVRPTIVPEPCGPNQLIGALPNAGGSHKGTTTSMFGLGLKQRTSLNVSLLRGLFA